MVAETTGGQGFGQTGLAVRNPEDRRLIPHLLNVHGPVDPRRRPIRPRRPGRADALAAAKTATDAKAPGLGIFGGGPTALEGGLDLGAGPAHIPIRCFNSAMAEATRPPSRPRITSTVP